jgi:hypothetical protein
MDVGPRVSTVVRAGYAPAVAVYTAVAADLAASHPITETVSATSDSPTGSIGSAAKSAPIAVQNLVAPDGTVTVSSSSAAANGVTSMTYTITNHDAAFTWKPQVTIVMPAGVVLVAPNAACTPNNRTNAPVYVCTLDGAAPGASTSQTLQVERTDAQPVTDLPVITVIGLRP